MPESSSDAPIVKIKLSAMSSESAGERESSGEMWVGISSNSPPLHQFGPATSDR